MKCVALWSGEWTVDLLIKIWSSGLVWTGHVNNWNKTPDTGLDLVMACHNIIRSSNKLRNVA